jgi:hypothetical protein
MSRSGWSWLSLLVLLGFLVGCSKQGALPSAKDRVAPVDTKQGPPVEKQGFKIGKPRR